MLTTAETMFKAREPCGNQPDFMFGTLRTCGVAIRQWFVGSQAMLQGKTITSGHQTVSNAAAGCCTEAGNICTASRDPVGSALAKRPGPGTCKRYLAARLCS